MRTPELSEAAELAALKAAERREARLLAITSVGLGVAQLLFIRWADVHLVRTWKLVIAGVVFLVYIGLIGWRVWRLDRLRTALHRPGSQEFRT
jgi:hypothetical protein